MLCLKLPKVRQTKFNCNSEKIVTPCEPHRTVCPHLNSVHYGTVKPPNTALVSLLNPHLWCSFSSLK